MNKMNLATKIGGGFGFVLVLLLIVALFSWQGLKTMSDGHDEYDRRTSNSTLAGTLQSNMLMVRMNVMSFMVTHNDKTLQDYKSYLAKLKSSLDEAKKKIKNPQRAANITLINTEVDSYAQAFEQLVIDIRESDRIISDRLRPLGPSMQKGLNEIMISAKTDQDVEAISKSGLATQHMILARLYAQRFFSSATEKDAELVGEESTKFQEIVGQLTASAHPDRKALAKKVLEEAKAYSDNFKQMAKSTISRNEVYNNTLTQVGPKIAAIVSEMLKSYADEQRDLGASLKATSQTSIRTTLIVALAAIFFGMGVSFLLTRAITGPIRKTSAFAEGMANGDLTSKLDVH